jgi:hypothetical protein
MGRPLSRENHQIGGVILSNPVKERKQGFDQVCTGREKNGLQ